MTQTIYLALALHNHQPVGNFDHVIAQAYDMAYLPMVQALERHPHVRLALHYTGPLREWLAAHRPDFLPHVRALVERGQVEMLGGGYYEPILVALPDADKAGQIQRMTQQVRDDFGYDAQGGWLAERVWEPHLAKPIHDAGLHYTIVDDTHFKYVGLSDKDLFGYYITEEQGTSLKVLGTSKPLRYMLPWGTVEKVLDYLRSEADETGTRVAVMGDDGEKFGLWPGTYPHCWGEDGTGGWIDEFFGALAENGDWLRPIPPGEFAAKFPPIGRVYLPTASYDEMTEWALPARVSGDLAELKHELEEEKNENLLRFIKGGMWRSFMVKYPEINTMHKKMLRVSGKVHTLADGPEKAAALDALWQGQCNCPYWHGVFGGIYLFHIRSANFSKLLEAENIADAARHGTGAWLHWEASDIDRDGQPEVLLESGAHNAYFAPHVGGKLYEWDWRPRCLNLGNTLSRRDEGYHRNLIRAAKEDKVMVAGEEPPAGEGEETPESIHTTQVRARERGLENLLFRDWYQRALLLDHFLPTETTLEEFYQVQYQELGDFVNRPYEYDVTADHDRLTLRLWRAGGVWQGNQMVPVRVEKRVQFMAESPTLRVEYSVSNGGHESVRANFGIESNWAMLGGNGFGAYYDAPGVERRGLDALGTVDGATQVALVLEWLRLRAEVRVSQAATVWHFPIETISNSEAGFERVYQGASVTTLWPLHLLAGETWEVNITYTLAEGGGE